MAEMRAIWPVDESGAASICSRYPISALVARRYESVPPLASRLESVLGYGFGACAPFVSRIGEAHEQSEVVIPWQAPGIR